MSSSLQPFGSAIAHSRRKETLKGLVKEISFSDYTQNTFGDVYSAVENNYGNVEGIGKLAIYDIAVAVCRHNNIPITKVYLIGNGPRRAAKILDLIPFHTKYEHIVCGKRLPYIEVQEVVDALQVHGHKVDMTEHPHFMGDHIESLLCNWQKNKK